MEWNGMIGTRVDWNGIMESSLMERNGMES